MTFATPDAITLSVALIVIIIGLLFGFGWAFGQWIAGGIIALLRRG